ncbi:MAG: UDP-N-acetylmuramyl pentapeptide phosphotransferase/UDP-N-acetylglucosamine-phosphate transferase [Chthonomonadaceae bacterium]|nr:UDP-N-acetylmuramyl pentapeptide phosphotransferase/UDP-N-acetylglucosamine-phosphate transferase [Chthonomonadaceae bacterium]
MMSPYAYPVFCAGVWALVVLPPLAEIGLRRIGHIEPNFRGERIPQSFGIVIVLGALPLLLILAPLASIPRLSLLSWLIALTGFGLLGLLDDFQGDKKIKGLRGHFRAAFIERRITTGFLKAIGGATIALGLGFVRFPHAPVQALLAAALIALSANAINLFDLRPGRAGAVFLLCAAGLLALGWQQKSPGALCLLCVVLPTLIVYLRDRRALAMMGDTGSNPLGACLGLALVEQPSTALRIVALILLIGLHVLAEKFSITKLIARFAPLRALDRLTGVR